MPLCSLGETRFHPPQGLITKGCRPPLRFHHMGWQSLGVRPRPRLARFAGHADDNLCSWFQGPCPYSSTTNIFVLFRFSITNSYFQSPRTIHSSKFVQVLLVSYWVHSSAVCVCYLRQFLVEGNSGYVPEPMPNSSSPKRKIRCFPAHLHTFVRQNQLEKENDQRLHLNLLITRACRMSTSDSSLVARNVGFTLDRFYTLKPSK